MSDYIRNNNNHKQVIESESHQISAEIIWIQLTFNNNGSSVWEHDDYILIQVDPMCFQFSS